MSRYLYEKDINWLITTLQELKPYLDVGMGYAEGKWEVTNYWDHGTVGEAKVIGVGDSIQEALRRAIEYYREQQ